MRRADTLACAAAVALVALGGCMKIYQDSELPDLEVELLLESCDGEAELSLSLVGLEDTSLRTDVNVPCEEGEDSFAKGKYTFVDLARERYRLEAKLSAMSPIMPGHAEVDLRNGLDARAFLYLDHYDNVRVSWTFDMGASCASLEADSVYVTLSSPSGPGRGIQSRCDSRQYSLSAPEGVYTVVARAHRGETPVAISRPYPEVTISYDTQTEVGLVLTPCGAESCEVPASTSGR